MKFNVAWCILATLWCSCISSAHTSTIHRCNETAMPVFCTVSVKYKKDFYGGKFKEWRSKSNTRNWGRGGGGDAISSTRFFLREDVKASKWWCNQWSWYWQIVFMHKNDPGREYDENCANDEELTPLICNRYPVYAPPFSSGWATVSGIEKCILGLFLSQIELYISEIWQCWRWSGATAAAIYAQIWPMG